MGLVRSASNSITVRLDAAADGAPASQLTAAVEPVGGRQPIEGAASGG